MWAFWSLARPCNSEGVGPTLHGRYLLLLLGREDSLARGPSRIQGLKVGLQTIYASLPHQSRLQRRPDAMVPLGWVSRAVSTAVLGVALSAGEPQTVWSAGEPQTGYPGGKYEIHF